MNKFLNKLISNKINATLFSLCIIMLLFTASCSPDADKKEKKFRIGFSQCCNDAWRDVMEGEMYRELAFYPEMEFEMRVADNNSETQIQQIQELISNDPDLLIVAPNESEPLTPIIEEIYQSGIPVILIDRKTNSDQYSAFLGGDNFAIGKTAAEYIANKWGKQGKILELSLPMSISPGVERHQGFKSVLQKFPNLEVVHTAIIDSIENLNKQLLTLVDEHQGINFIFAHTDMLAENAFKILHENGKGDDLIFLGIDGIPGTGKGIHAVEEGILNASFLYPTGGAEAIRLASAILNDEPYTKQNLLQTTVIDSENARILNYQMNKVENLQKSIDKQISKIEELKTIYRNQRTGIFILVSSLFLAIVFGGFLFRSLRSKQRMNKSLNLKNQEILTQQEQIISMAREIKEVTEEKVSFFTNMSHEFRTPLTLILGFADDLLSVIKKGTENSKSLNLIKENAFRLLHLVNQLMDFRKTERSAMKVRAGKMDVVDFVKSIMRSYHKTAENRGIDFQLITQHEKLVLWFDRSMLDKVIFNLLSNAFKFTPDKGKIYVSISENHSNNEAIIVVEDSGIGMSEEDAQHIFEPFYQSKEQQKGGTGLGLPLSRKLIELQKGTLEVKSVKSKGSQFIIKLKLGKSHFGQDQLNTLTSNWVPTEDYFNRVEAEGFEEEGQKEPHTFEHTILIIEDNEELQYFLQKKLGEEYQIHSSTRGEKGFQIATNEIPDLIICDVMMPDSNGLDITQRLKSDLRTSHIPVVLLTAQSTLAQQIQGARAGADAYITKPFNIFHLKEIVKNLLENRKLLKEKFKHGLIILEDETEESSLDQRFIKKFQDYIEENYARQDLQVTDLWEELNLSRSQFYRKVKAILGQSVTEYIQNLRLKKAEDLLLAEDLPIGEIAFLVGYSSPDYFAKVFKAKNGMVPSHFKQHVIKD